MAHAEAVIRSEILSPAVVVFVFGLWSFKVALVVISGAVVKRFVAPLYMLYAHAAPAPAAAVLTAVETGRRYESLFTLRSQSHCGLEASAISSPGIDIRCL